MELYSKGKRGLVYLSIAVGKRVIVKTVNPKSKAFGRIESEAKFLQILNKHGPNPNEVVGMIRDREIYSIIGNHDRVAVGKDSDTFFNGVAKKAIRWTVRELTEPNRKYLASLKAEAARDIILSVHGAPGSPYDYIEDAISVTNYVGEAQRIAKAAGITLKAVLFGHSHCSCVYDNRGNSLMGPQAGQIPLDLANGKVYFINPGAVGQPRDRLITAPYGIIDTIKGTYEHFRTPYDIDRTDWSIRKKRLPDELADRLWTGK